MKRLAVLVALAACGDDAAPLDRRVEAPGAHAVGTARFEVTDVSRSRTLVVQGWFPTETTGSPVAIEALELEPIRAQYAGLLATAPSCASRTLPVTVDAAPIAGSYPLVLISHCHSCTRLSNATTAIRLASHGFAVASVEHLGDTLWNHLAGVDAPINSAELEIRAADVRFVLDQIAAGTTPFGGRVDLAHVGVLGHSMGAITAGRVAQTDPRIDAAMALAAPVENPLVPGVTLADIAVPLMFLLAREDNSITAFGNELIVDNFTDAPGPAWKLEVPDAGHWSVSDLAGLVDVFAPGCGQGVRQTDDQPFTYLDPEVGRALTASYATAFFLANLTDDAGARGYLGAASPSYAIVLDAKHHD